MRVLASACCRSSTLALQADGSHIVVAQRNADGAPIGLLRLDADELGALLEVLERAAPVLELRRAS